MAIQPQLIYAGTLNANFQDPEPWGKALSYSTFVHGLAAFLFFALALGQKPVLQTVLTEVSFVEQKELIPDAPIPTGGSIRGDVAGGGGQLGAPGKAEPVESHTDLKNVVPYSSPQGSPDGTIVTDEAMSGPIIKTGDIGLVGRKKGALVPLVGRTEGRPAKNLLPTLTGGTGAEQNKPIALSTEDMGAIRKKEGSIGVPLISRSIASGAGAGTGQLQKLANSSAGAARDLKFEKLKANPLDEEKWGKSKGPFSMEGPLKYRKILKMNLPPYPRWAEEQGIEASVSFRLWVNPKGKVKPTLYLEKASGYAELDQLAKDALTQFIFVPLPETVTQEDEWGVATFRFELKH